MARRGSDGGSTMGGGGMMAPVLSVATGLLIFVILIIFAPTIAGSVESAQPAMSATSNWNSTNNPDLPDGTEVWTTKPDMSPDLQTVGSTGVIIQIIGVVVLIISIAIAMSRYYGLRLVNESRNGVCQNEVSMIFDRVDTTSKGWLEAPLSNPCTQCRDWAM